MSVSVTDAMQKRSSIRGFTGESVPEAVLQELFEKAQLSASNCNTQPWHVTVVSGEKRQQLEETLMTEIMSGKAASPAFKPGDADLDGVYKERQYGCAAGYYSTMGIERADKGARTELALKNWQFFGAPHVAFISMPTTMGAVNAIDIGIYLQSLMLLMVERGLASCPQGALAFYPDPVKAMAGIPEGHGILCGISFGYEDKGARINDVKMDRAPLLDSVNFVA